MDVAELIAIVGTLFTLLSVIVGVAWRLAARLARMEASISRNEEIIERELSFNGGLSLKDKVMDTNHKVNEIVRQMG